MMVLFVTSHPHDFLMLPFLLLLPHMSLNWPAGSSRHRIASLNDSHALIGEE